MTLIKTNIVREKETTFFDINVRDYFIFEEECYCKIHFMKERDTGNEYNAFCIGSGSLTLFDNEDEVTPVLTMGIECEL